MSALPAKTAISDTYPNPSNATARTGFANLWDAINEFTEKSELDIASATTCSIGAALSTKLRVTGTTTITSFGTTYRGPILLRFSGAVTLTYNATTLLIPGAANYTTVAGDLVLAWPKATTSGTLDGWQISIISGRIPDQLIYCHTGNGAGSTNTRIRRFTTEMTNIGANTYADSAANGASFTINASGIYSIVYGDYRVAGAANLGISLNSSQLTTSILSINIADRLALTDSQTNSISSCVAVARLVSGDVIRPHFGSNAPDSTDNSCFFILRRIAL